MGLTLIQGGLQGVEKDTLNMIMKDKAEIDAFRKTPEFTIDNTKDVELIGLISALISLEQFDKAGEYIVEISLNYFYSKVLTDIPILSKQYALYLTMTENNSLREKHLDSYKMLVNNYNYFVSLSNVINYFMSIPYHPYHRHVKYSVDTLNHRKQLALLKKDK